MKETVYRSDRSNRNLTWNGGDCLFGRCPMNVKHLLISIESRDVNAKPMPTIASEDLAHSFAFLYTLFISDSNQQ
jgi:hypothetical protein